MFGNKITNLILSCSVACFLVCVKMRFTDSLVPSHCLCDVPTSYNGVKSKKGSLKFLKLLSMSPKFRSLVRGVCAEGTSENIYPGKLHISRIQDVSN
jgi:hypothetical protein